MKEKIFLYLVLPVYNEEEILEQNISILLDAFSKMRSEGEITDSSRILFVDDGSSDRSWDIICRRKDPEGVIEGIRLSRNEGHQTALYAGMEEAFRCRAEVVVTMDADLQQDIRALPRFFDAYRNGADIVNGIRSSRKTDGFFKRTSAGLYYRCMKWLGCDLVPDSADYRLFSAKALGALMEYGERDLFIRGIVPTLGFRTASVTFDVQPRALGKSKYTLRKMIGFAAAGITSFSIRPIRLVFLMGLLVLLASAVMMIHILWDHFHGNTVSGWSSILASIWLLGGIGIFSIGIVGEYVGRAYMEAKKRPRYFIEDRLNTERILTDSSEAAGSRDGLPRTQIEGRTEPEIRNEERDGI